ncbi:protein-L-isoaspartate O-methyltransferase family protein [Sphingomonas sediminicola]|uniref:protein-L-isoaspartate O-methyltransferase family protein n=1 Tax=Sphingomonas sediminicola TaxID=386874 RepID=UPI0024834B21|nr:hypothetical protein [Sphingomonas sediminicola]
MLGRLLTALTALRGERALVVGASTGYSAAVLAKMGLKVTALESSAALAAIARGNGVEAVEGPLAKGHGKASSYDLILIDGAVEQIPDALVDQLVEGGRIGGAIVEQGITRLFIGRRVGGASAFNRSPMHRLRSFPVSSGPRPSHSRFWSFATRDPQHRLRNDCRGLAGRHRVGRHAA